MKKNIGVVGHKTKLGSLLVQKSNFVSIDDEVYNNVSVKEKVDIIINCDVAQVTSWGKEYERAITTNVRGLFNLHRSFGKNIIAISSTEVKKHPETQFGMVMLGAEVVSHVCEGKVIRVPKCKTQEDYQFVADQIEKIAEKFDTVSRLSICKLPNWYTRLWK